MGRRARPTTHGFTLVELLMAATLLGVLMVGLVAHLRGGVVAWRRTMATVEALQHVRVVLEQLTRDLANATVVDPRPEAAVQFVLASDELRLVTVRPPGHLDGPRTLRVVHYQLQPTAGSSTLTRTVQTIREAQAGLPPRVERLLSGVKTFSVRYGYQPAPDVKTIEWRSSWKDHTQLPKLVEITLAFGRTPLRVSRIHHRVAIPSGSLVPEEKAGTS